MGAAAPQNQVEAIPVKAADLEDTLLRHSLGSPAISSPSSLALLALADRRSLQVHGTVRRVAQHRRPAVSGLSRRSQPLEGKVGPVIRHPVRLVPVVLETH